MESKTLVSLKAPAVSTAPATPVAVKSFGPGRCVNCGKPVVKTADDGFGSTCEEHKGIMRRSATILAAVPEGWVRMSKVCRALEAAGFSTSEIVKAAGGDACTGTILAPCFNVVYVGRGKWMAPEVLTEGIAILKGASKVVETKKAETSTGSIVADILKQNGKVPAKK